ncbi:penicillin-binding protein [Longibacter salinarum]|uniref:Penicillin-binding protein n=1 Tax=Longibacter salinarum TaxID=1850348 RepID=A0A2A8CVN1_9BACT|nr:PASTA domain-containing protein [Longibacter salinarum]PEN12305.1 penicillin-binding protein [Longibacter salinarum]
MSSPPRFQRFTNWLKQIGRNPYFWSGLGAIILVAFGFYFVFNSILMPSYTRHDASIQVPDVMDRPFEEAQETLRGRDLAVERQVGRFNPRVPQNEVVDQNPPPNSSVKPGRRVYLTVNSGTAPTVSVPDLTGTSLREARNRLTSLGLEVGQERVDSIPSPYARTVTRQQPEPGDSLKKGSSVDIWYSQGLGDEQVVVPNVQGLRVDVAKGRLLRQKLRSVVIDATADDSETDEEPSDDQVEENNLWVRNQSLEPGRRVASGREVRLFATPDSTAVPEPQPRTPPSDTSSTEPSDESDESNDISF